MLNFTTAHDAISHGTATGESDGATLYNENRDGYRDEAHATSGLDNCASEAASVLGVPREYYRVWINAYATAAARVIRGLYNA